MSQPLLSVKNLEINFKTGSENIAAIRNSSFDINKGETLAIVGESGSGKTVTSLSILQLLPPQAEYKNGEILFCQNDEQVNLLSLNNKNLQKIRGKKISMIFQEPMTSLNPVRTCGSQVIEALQIHKNINFAAAKNKTIELFNKVQLPDAASMLNRYPHQLSGGQKQRVMIAMAISCEPSLLIADEPTTALDVTVQKTIIALIKDLQQQQNMAVIYITHDLALVSEIADKVIVMYKGEIVETNTTKELFLHPQHAYTKALIACRPTASSKGKRLFIINDFLNEKNVTDPVHFSIKDSAMQINNADTEILKVESLSVHFPLKKTITGKIISEFKAVDDVSFTVNRGETVGLVGESGCGKTTLGRALIRLIEPTSGNIFLNKKDIAYITKEELRKMRKDIQIVFQDPYGSLNPRMIIGEAIDEPMKIHNILSTKKDRKEKIIDLLKKVDLKPEHFNHYPHEFSGGQRQRICIARALSLHPEFIICDESVSALDVSVQAQVLNLLNNLKKELGFTCIFISHDLGVVHYISDRIMVMNKGKIEETGTADEIYFNPKRDYTKRLIESIPKVKL